MTTHAIAHTYLVRALNNPAADFQPGQWEAIEALVEQRGQLLVVQRTGWGKSMVYFLATRLLRDQGAGPTLLISPLLALMRNQLEAAARIGLRAVRIDSTNYDAWPSLIADVTQNRADILLVSPERLSNERFRQEVLAAVNIGLFVVDEAHCISDWGHDFRPDYRRITRVLQALPATVPVLATTATANNRVVADIQAQLGKRLRTLRGPLTRDSLQLQVIALPAQAARLAWLAEQVPRLPGSGIIYARTVCDAELVARWLTHKFGPDRPVAAYHAGSEHREELEQRLLRNELKALVATGALGMGFDKSDLRFVIHFQRPGSVVEYYQQVGRAGRNQKPAYGGLLCGQEDGEISEYFTQAAFAPVAHTRLVLDALADSEGLSQAALEGQVNLSRGQIQKVLKQLDVLYPSPVAHLENKWYRTSASWQPDEALVAAVTARRRAEVAEVNRYAEGATCLMQFLRQALDDPAPAPCGNCAVCRRQPLLPETAAPTLVQEAVAFLKNSHLPLLPRKKWADMRNIPLHEQAAEGRILCIYGDAGWGQLVKEGKYATERFDEALVRALAELVQARWGPQPAPQWVTAVPSRRRPSLVPDVARRLAVALQLPYLEVIRKTVDTPEQKTQQNSVWQQRNVLEAFTVEVPAAQRGQPVLLVDDVVDSRWTFAVLAALLRRHGAGAVYPLALAQASTHDD